MSAINPTQGAVQQIKQTLQKVVQEKGEVKQKGARSDVLGKVRVLTGMLKKAKAGETFSPRQIELISKICQQVLNLHELSKAPGVPTQEPQGANFTASRTPPSQRTSRSASNAARRPIQQANRQAAQQSDVAKMKKAEAFIAQERVRLESQGIVKRPKVLPESEEDVKESERLAKHAKKKEKGERREMAKVKRWGRKAIDEDKSEEEKWEGKGIVKRTGKKALRRVKRAAEDAAERVSPPKRRLGF